jgi:sugar O-acyltransferase (sialic acid O-acetyltransferase NeuD family)
MISSTDIPKVILGAGKQARHYLDLMEWMGLDWRSVRLYDDRHPELTAGARDLPVHGKIADGISYALAHSAPALIAFGSRFGADRFALFRRAVESGIKLASLIHSSCLIAPTATIGLNTALMPGTIVGSHSSVGSACCLFSGVIVEHDVRIGDNVVLGPSVTLSGYCEIGDHCFIGAGATCIPSVKVGQGTLVGAGAVVARDLSDGVVARGVPARAVRAPRDGDDVPTPTQLHAILRRRGA